MFYGAKEFNGKIGTWETFRVLNSWLMFVQAKKFNQDISNWFMGQNTNMESMFEDAEAFNQDISGWSFAPRPVNINSMFYRASSFNQDLCSWIEGLQGSGNDRKMYSVFDRTSCPDQRDFGDVDLGETVEAMCVTC